jgi:hypothetical protein
MIDLEQAIWVTCPIQDGKKLPNWKRRSMFLPPDKVFIPAGVFMNEQTAILYASHDGNTTIIMDDGHIYLPAVWFANEFPKLRETIEEVARIVREYAAKIDD